MRTKPAIFAAIFLAESLMFVNTGPCNAIIANVVQPNLRAAAYSIALFAVHFLGRHLVAVVDRQSFRPVRRCGDDGRTHGPGGPSDRSCAHPSHRPGANIVAGQFVVVPALVLAGILLLTGARPAARNGLDAGETFGVAGLDCAHVEPSPAQAQASANHPANERTM